MKEINREKRQANTANAGGEKKRLRCSNLEDKFKEMQEKLQQPMEINWVPLYVITAVMSLVTLGVYLHGVWQLRQREKLKRRWLNHRLPELARLKELERRKYYGEPYDDLLAEIEEAERLKNAPKSLRKKAAKAEPTEAPKETPKEAQNEVPKEAPKEAPKKAPKEAPMEAPNEAPKEASKEELAK